MLESRPQTRDWTPEKTNRLRSSVKRAHPNGICVSSCTMDGAVEEGLSYCRFHDYKFGPFVKAGIRWRAAIAARVDYIASDHYKSECGVTPTVAHAVIEPQWFSSRASSRNKPTKKRNNSPLSQQFSFEL
jgi:hypothetical protein